VHKPSGAVRQRGFTLIEILVGVAIGVVGLLVIFQTMAVWNRHTQSTSSGGDSDTSGTLAMFNLERDLRLGGYGIGTVDSTMSGCAVAVTNVANGTSFHFPLTPVVIVEGAGGAPDTINVLYGNSSFFTTGEQINSSVGETNALQRRNGFKQGDLAVVTGILAGAPSCSLVEITDTSAADGFTVSHANGTPYVNYYTGASAASGATFNPSPAYPVVTSSGMLYDLGPQPRLNQWTIVNQQVLQRTDLIHGTPPFDVAEGIINLKAQYGVDANLDGRIDSGEWTTTAPVDWNTVLAVRIAILVRSSQFERSADAGASSSNGAVTTVNPSWSGGNFLMTDVNGGADSNLPGDPSNWRYYRYRVFERIIPLRNMIWG